MSFRPTAPIENLRKRAEVLRLLRKFFESGSFLEVQTPVLSADTIVDRHVEPLSITDESFPKTLRGERRFFLQTSPEFALKRLLAAGMEAVFQIGPVFRRGDRGRHHNVEFTMLEWYRVGDDYRDGMNRLADLIRFVADSASFQTNVLSNEIVRDSYENLFERYVGIDPHAAPARECKAAADRHGLSYPESFPEHDSVDTNHWLDLLFSELVQPELKAAIVYDFPASQSQLARSRSLVKNGIRYAVTERFELFLSGLEIANGYHELLDAEELRRRFRTTAEQRVQDGRFPLPVESRLLEAMEFGLPPCSGTALGVDRFLMALLGVDSIDRVMAFPIETA